MAEPARARLVIDLDALAHNFHVLKAEAGGAEVAPVVKADGYGLGSGPIARRLWAEGARSFFVARLAEAETLRAELGPDRPAVIYVLDGFVAGAADLTPVISTPAQAAACVGPVALHVDTGMNRQGLTLEEARTLHGLDVSLVMSHLGSAADPSDPRNAEQLRKFQQAIDLFPNSRRSIAASAGIFLGEHYRFDMVRPGVSLYGGGPLERTDGRLKAVATLSAPILDIRHLRAGDRLGYGSRTTVQAPTRIAVVAAGYADGVLRAAMGRGYGWFAEARRPLLLVNMDLAAVDIGDAPARVGEHVELLGPNALLDDLATAAGTVAHEVLVRLSRRADRVYLGEA